MAKRTVGRPRGATLTTEQVLDAALALAEEQGLEGLTIRSLAERLEVGRTAIYHHAGSIEAVHEAVGDRVMARFPMPQTDPADWRGWYEELLVGVHETLLRYPGVSELIRRSGPQTPQQLAFIERATGVLLDAGFSARSAALGYGFLFATTTGSVELRLAERASAEEVPATWAGALPATEVGPALAAVLPVYLATSGDEFFRYAIRTALDGLEQQRLAEQASASGG